MILFLSDGRLGNQLFQYAFLKTLSRPNESVVFCNAPQLLKVFDLNDPGFYWVNTPLLIILARKFFYPVLKWLASMGVISLIFQEKSEDGSISYPRYQKRKGSLAGIQLVETDFFQSEVFFDAHKLSIKLKDEYIQAANDFLTMVPAGSTAVFVHVRRGDYLREIYRGVRGFELPDSYYFKAMDMVASVVNNPFFVFLSDEPGYIESMFSSVPNKIVSRNDMNIDFAIMSCCKAGIMSNSSFSWWGSYFMKSRLIVISPKYWYGWRHHIESHPDIYPSFSIVIDVGG